MALLKALLLTASAAILFLLAGCFATGTTTPPAPPAAGSAASANLTVSQVLSAYVQTFATSSSVTASSVMAQPGGAQGMAAGPTLPTTATQSTSWKTVSVGWDDPVNPTKFDITVEGKTYSLPMYNTGTTTSRPKRPSRTACASTNDW